MEQECDNNFFDNIKVSDIVKAKLKILDSVEIKFEPKSDIVADTEDDELSLETNQTGEDAIIKEESSFTHDKMNHEDTRNCEPVIGDFFFETSEAVKQHLDEYDFESIGPDMFWREVEKTEEFDFDMIKKVVLEREEERGRRRG